VDFNSAPISGAAAARKASIWSLVDRRQIVGDGLIDLSGDLGVIDVAVEPAEARHQRPVLKASAVGAAVAASGGLRLARSCHASPFGMLPGAAALGIAAAAAPVDDGIDLDRPEAAIPQACPKRRYFVEVRRRIAHGHTVARESISGPNDPALAL
jgi:hypothetical protein